MTEGADFYEDQRERLGDEFLASVFEDLQALEFQGGIHTRAHGLYRKLAKRFPFAIYYEISKSKIDVIAILDCRRSPHFIARRLEKPPA